VPENPFEARRRGIRRVNALTASIAGAAVAGTGVVAVAVASTGTAHAGSSTPTVQQQPRTDGDDGVGSDQGGAGDDGLTPPQQLPGNSGSSGGLGGLFGGGGGGHASSGGS